jgi:hypothetical protein
VPAVQRQARASARRLGLLHIACAAVHRPARASARAPRVFEPELGDPALDIGELEALCTHAKNACHVLELTVGSSFTRPLELGDDRILGRRRIDLHTQNRDPTTPPELFDRERPRLANDQVELPARRHIDDVEHRAPAQCISSDVAIDVVVRGSPCNVLANEPTTMNAMPSSSSKSATPRRKLSGVSAVMDEG